MSLDDIIQLSITAVTQAPTRAGFGIPLLASYHSLFPEQAKTFGSMAEIEAAGFTSTTPTHRMATKAFGQNPRPRQVVVGKRSTAFTQVVELRPLKTTEGYHYVFDLVASTGATTSIDYTVAAAATTTSVGAALAALLDPAPNVAAAAALGVITLTSTAGTLFNLKSLPSIEIMEVKDVSADPGIASDLTAIELADPRTWYALMIDHEPEAVINATAAWIETRRKIYLPTSADSGISKSGVTTDVASDLKAAAYVRSAIMYSQSELLPYSGAAWAGVMLPKPPGSATWAFKTLAGVVADVLSTAQTSALPVKNASYYTEIGGLNKTFWGTGGNGGYLDIAIGIDWLYARIQEAVFGVLGAADKIPQTDSGTDTIRNAILAVLMRGTKAPANFLSATPTPTVTFPKWADIDAGDKTARLLPDGEIEATVSGAIHKVGVTARLSI
jgi:hypothetical protein